VIEHLTTAGWFLPFIVLVALTFDFLNGFHDAANSIATVVSTRVLSPGVAVVWAAFFNFVAAFVLGTHVAKTIGKGMIDISVVTHEVVLAGLLGAIFWNLITWYYGLPVSSSHALIGGYAGAAVAKAGFSALVAGGWVKPLAFIVIAPLMGMTLAFILTVAVTWIFRKWHPFKLDRLFRKLQLLSAGVYSLGHGGNDAQKTMGIITGLRHHVRRLADRQDHGHEDHQAAALRRLLRRDRRRHHLGGRHARRHPGVDHPHHHRSDHRCRRHAPDLGGEVGRRRADRVGLGDHHPGVGPGRRGGLLPGRPSRLAQPAARAARSFGSRAS
jgi:hypothetical protein